MTKKTFTQIRPFIGILRASLIATMRNPASIVFGFVFPLVFIVVFGVIGGSGGEYEVAIDSSSDTSNPIYESLKKIESLELKENLDAKAVDEDLAKGNLDALVKINRIQTNGAPKYSIDITTTSASPQNGSVVTSIVSSLTDKINLSAIGTQDLPITLQTNEVIGRKYKQIDFILPGQLGFALLSSGIFATAFAFIAFRQTLVLKRFFTTPVSKVSIILGEGVSRLIFAVVQSSFIIIVGAVFFDYTLIYGVETFLQMLVLSMIGLTVFLGLGFIVSSISKDERTAAPLAQLFTLPQFLLAGTFFPVELFPTWLQPIGRAMPLFFLNNAMRKVAFEGADLLNVLPEIGFLFLWGVVIYAVAVKVFKWE